MTEDKHCYKNAVSERVNGILEDESYLDITFFSTKIARKVVKTQSNYIITKSYIYLWSTKLQIRCAKKQDKLTIKSVAVFIGLDSPTAYG